MSSRIRLLAVGAMLAPLSIAAPASAEIAVLTSGRTLTIKAHRLDGDRIVLQMRDGGEVTCDRTLIEKIVADEIPYQEPQPAVSAASQAPQSSAVAPAAVALPASPYTEIITAMAQAHGIDPLLVHALIQVESGYKPTARSHKGAMGLMQLMPATARQYNVRNPYDPKANIAAGVKHLKSLIDRWGVELALAAYNAGEGAVKKFRAIPPYRETRSYVARILSLSGQR